MIIDYIYKATLYISCRANWNVPRHGILAVKKTLGGKPLIGAEIGIQYGAHSRSVLNTLNIEKLYLIDPYTWYEGIDDYKSTKHNEIKEEAQRKVKKYGDKVEFIEKFSHDAAKILPELDFVYVDGNHYYEYVKQDLEDYYPLIKKGGVLCGHDFNIPDVAQAVTEFAAKIGKEIGVDGYPSDWWIIV